MGGGGSVLFTDVREFASRLPGSVQLVMVNETPFRARLTWVALRGLLLLHARETVRRVGYLSLPVRRVSAFFPADRTSLLVCDGSEIGPGKIVLYGEGARTHQRTLGAARWSSVSVETTMLRDVGMMLTGQNVADPAGMILHVVGADWRQFLRLHAEAMRIAETRLLHIGHPQVARALEQELIWALVNSLSTAEVLGRVASFEDCDVLARFELCLTRHMNKPLRLSAICRCINVSERTLNVLCRRVLGVSPARYQRLRALAAGSSEQPDRQ